MFHFIALFILAVTGPQITPVSSHATAMQDASVSRTTTPPRTSATNAVSAVRRESANRLCNALAQFPRSETDKLNFEKNEVGSLCKPYMQRTRASLDMCGDGNSDPYTSAFTWASREQMAKRGKINIVSDPKAQPLYTALLSRAEEIRHETANI